MTINTFNRLLIALVVLFSTTANAYEMIITGGVQTTDVDIDGGNPSGGTGFYVGVLGLADAGPGGFFRTGALLSQRKFENESTGIATLKAEMLSLDVPLTYLFMFSEMVGAFGGLKLGLNLSDSCKTNVAGIICETKAESLHYAAEFGGQFRFAPDMGVEVAFNLGLSDIAEDVEWKSGISAGFTYFY